MRETTAMLRDAYYMPPTVEQVRKFAAAKGIPEMEAKLRIAAGRERFLTAMREDPYTHGYEPDIWLVVKALFRGVEPTRAQRERVRKILNLEWNDFAERMRRHLGFTKPVGEVLIMGANRSGKTDFASKLAMQLADSGGKSMLVGFQTLKTGKGTQMKRLWNYMPKPFKEKNIALKKASRIDEHISYTEQNGFAGSKITFGNRSILDFVTYEMDVKSIEGSEYDFGWLDEEFPQSFLSTLRSRLASKKGILLGTFTPISGYTPVVADFLDGMQVTKWHTAYMLPLDGGIVEPWSELGLTPEEYTALMDDSAEVPESRPEECLKWLLGEGEKGRADGRAFVRTPRVAVCKGGEAAAVWFYGSDNPYGSPGSVIRSAAKNRRATSEIKARVYGIAEKLSGRLFPKFSREKNVIPLEALPKRLVRIHVVDPAPERNWCNGWYGYEKATDTLYKYREWPGNYEVPGVGVPPPWAQLSDRNHGVNDGEYAGGQEDFGMSFLKYKYEWARLERWKDFTDWVKEGHDPLEWPENLDEVEEWTELMGTEEPIAERVIDARAASQSKMSMKENLTLFDEVAKLAEGFLPASGQQIAVGLAVLRDRIEDGRYKVTANCTNTIFAYENYTGKDGQKGAVKDWIDCDRYAALSGIFEYGEEDATECGPGAAKQPSQRNFENENDVPDDDFASWADD
jgi:phage terminase large subunit-like protein